MKNQDFTFQDAYKIQSQHIIEWSTVLNPDAYLALLRKTIEENAKEMESPYEVFRGSDISNFIQNLMVK